SVIPNNLTITKGRTSSITSVTAHYSDGTKDNILNKCVFKSNNTNVATVSTNGAITALSVGNTTINVSYTEEGITESFNVAVTVKSSSSSGST
ncbi:MAG TPA: Ig-like domain-containing protein, partial [Atribacterota bacterium]|nr:Ig-like domain-containing protein [Atribacterota bacterium]